MLDGERKEDMATVKDDFERPSEDAIYQMVVNSARWAIAAFPQIQDRYHEVGDLVSEFYIRKMKSVKLRHHWDVDYLPHHIHTLMKYLAQEVAGAARYGTYTWRGVELDSADRASSTDGRSRHEEYADEHEYSLDPCISFEQENDLAELLSMIPDRILCCRSGVEYSLREVAILLLEYKPSEIADRLNVNRSRVSHILSTLREILQESPAVQAVLS